MSAIVGIYNRDGVAPADLLPAMLAARPERGPDGVASWSAGPIALGHGHFWLSPEEWGERPPVVDGELALSADAHLGHRAELGRLLGLEDARLAATSDAQLILAAYRIWGHDCLDHLLGDYAFLLWDGGRGELFAARDALGTRGLCYTAVNDRLFLFASDVAHLLACPLVRPNLNYNRIAAYLAVVPDRPEETFFTGIHFLPPGHALLVSPAGQRVWRHWEPDPERAIRYRDERDYAARYRELLTEAVRDRLRVVGPVSISLSGGLDSTTLAALAAPILSGDGRANSRLRSYSYSFDELASCDERHTIAPVAERYGLDAAYLPCDDKWTLKDVDAWPTTPDYVLADSFAWLPDAVMAAAGGGACRALLGGYFGDVLMTGAHYWALDMLRDGRLGMLARSVTRHRRSIPWRTSFGEFGLRRLIPAEMSEAYRRVQPRPVARNFPGIHADLIAVTDIRERLSPPTAPRGMRAPGYWQRYRSLTYAGFSEGPAAVRYQYNRRGLELILPYHDRRLVEFVLAVPGYVLGRPGANRRLHREAMLGLLPEEVRLRPNPTSFVPLLIKGLRDREAGTMRRILTDPLVVRRGYIDGEWLRRQLERPFAPSAESGMLTRALYLELWLQRHWCTVE